MARRRPAGLGRPGLTAPCLLAACLLCGCAGGRWAGAPSSLEGEERASGLFQRMACGGALSGWKAEEEPEVGEGLTGLMRLVDGAAEDLWQRGVSRAEFQSFEGPDEESLLELQRYTFREEAQAIRFREEGCRTGLEMPADRGPEGQACVACGPAWCRALHRRSRQVIEVRFYGDEQSGRAMLARIEKELASAPW